MKFLADDTQAVVLIDVAKGRKSSVFQKGFELASDKLPQLGIVKLEKVDTVVIAQAGSKNVIVVEGKLDPVLAELKKQSTGSSKHGAVTYWSTPDADFALIDKKLVLASPGTLAAVIDRAADKKRAKGPAKVRTWLAAGQSGAALVVAGAPDANVAKDLTKQFGASPSFAVVSISPATNLTIEVRAQFPDETGAEAAHKKLEALISSDVKDRLEAFVGKEFADSVQIDRDHNTVRGSAVMTDEETDKVLGFARMFM